VTISSASTYEEIEAEYLDTLAYEREGSVSKAYRHAEACRALRLKRPNTATKGSNTVTYSAEDLAKAEKDALAYARSTAASSEGSSSFIRASFKSLRDHG
jgi:hypothetical protein